MINDERVIRSDNTSDEVWRLRRCLPSPISLTGIRYPVIAGRTGLDLLDVQ
jgi:hypothetical protein